MFNNELDILELRFNTLFNVVDKFVLVESSKTFSGIDKPLFFQENKTRFSQFLDKITHIIYNGPHRHYDLGSHITTPCHSNERNQRNAIMEGLSDCSPDDIIWLSDTDEIPDPKGAHWLPEPRFVFNTKMYMYFMNYRVLHRAPATVAIRYGAIDTPNTDMLARMSGPYIDGGWHFSFMGGASVISEKLQSTCHQEYNKPEIRDVNNIKKIIAAGGSVVLLPDKSEFERYGWNWPEDGKLLHLDPVDENLPQFLVQNIDKYEKYLAQNIEKDVWSDKFI